MSQRSRSATLAHARCPGASTARARSPSPSCTARNASRASPRGTSHGPGSGCGPTGGPPGRSRGRRKAGALRSPTDAWKRSDTGL
eukprot:1861343-Pyramimonas_sp.AAC.1